MNDHNKFRPEKDNSAPTPEKLTEMFGDDLQVVRDLESIMDSVEAREARAAQSLNKSVENPNVPLTEEERNEYNVQNELAEMDRQKASGDAESKESRMARFKKWIGRFLTS